MRAKMIQSWQGMGRLACALLIFLACKPESSPTGSLVAAQDAGSAPTQADAGAVTSSRTTDAGIPDAGIPATATSGQPHTGAATRPLQRVPSLKLRPVASEEAFIREHAQDEGWDTSAQRLKSYWHPASRAEDDRLGHFILGHLSNPDEPRGGEQGWMLLREHGGKLAVYGPLITQQPWTPDYMHKVKPVRMTLKTLDGHPGKLLWIQIQDKLTTPLDPQGERLDAKTRLLDYGFLVDARGGFTPLAFQLPEKVTQEINDETTAETTLTVSFTAADRMVITAGPEGANPEQQAWIGEHRIGE
ncbi:hypothetical protein NR798_31415 [Archangium gephyra]|uniref:hypothetical protein n=1 Tax=Archangium gephyra TaxID=48 RepID=UPI0035D3EBBC